MSIDCNEKDAGIAGCTFYKNAVRWEIVSRSKLTSVEGHSRGCFLCFVEVLCPCWQNAHVAIFFVMASYSRGGFCDTLYMKKM